MEKCNWCGREVQNGVYYGKGLFPSFYCSNRCLNRAIHSGMEKPGGKAHSASPVERFMIRLALIAFAIPVLAAILDAIINAISNLFK